MAEAVEEVTFAGEFNGRIYGIGQELTDQSSGLQYAAPPSGIAGEFVHNSEWGTLWGSYGATRDVEASGGL